VTSHTVSQPFTVLVVDDQPIIGEGVRRLLAVVPEARVEVCARATEALAVACALQPAVILQDIHMPDGDGLELVERYRWESALAETSVVVLSAEEQAGTKAEAFARGADDYLVKLPPPQEFIARIVHHADAARAQRERNQAFRALERAERDLARRNALLDQANARLAESNRELVVDADTQRERLDRIEHRGREVLPLVDHDRIERAELARARGLAERGDERVVALRHRERRGRRAARRVRRAGRERVQVRHHAAVRAHLPRRRGVADRACAERRPERRGERFVEAGHERAPPVAELAAGAVERGVGLARARVSLDLHAVELVRRVDDAAHRAHRVVLDHARVGDLVAHVQRRLHRGQDVPLEQPPHGRVPSGRHQRIALREPRERGLDLGEQLLRLAAVVRVQHVVPRRHRDRLEIEVRIDQCQEPAVKVLGLLSLASRHGLQRAHQRVHRAQRLRGRLAAELARRAAHDAVPPELGVELAVAALDLDDDEPALRVDDHEVDLARADAVGILHQQVLDDDPWLVGERALEARAHDELRLVGHRLRAFDPDLEDLPWVELRHGPRV